MIKSDHGKPPFSIKGDCGSVVYIDHDGILKPVGIIRLGHVHSTGPEGAEQLTDITMASHFQTAIQHFKKSAMSQVGRTTVTLRYPKVVSVGTPLGELAPAPRPLKSGNPPVVGHCSGFSQADL